MQSGEAAPGTSTELTVESAAQALLPLLSGEPEEQQSSDAPPQSEETEVEETEATEPAESEDEDQTEPVESDEESEPAEETEAEPSQPKTYRVKVDGEEVEVTEDELLRGYSRNADYTRKTQALAAERAAFEQSEKAAVIQERQRYATALAQIEQIVDGQLAGEPDWDTLRKEVPADEFAATWADWERAKRQQAAVKAERAKAEEQVRKDAEAAYAAHLATEGQRVLDVIPAWKDPEVKKAESREIVEYARELGFTDEEIQKVADHRLVKLLRDAAQGRKQAKAKATAEPIVRKKIEQAKVVKPGAAASTKPVVTEMTRAKQALAKTGSLHDAAAAIRLMLADE